MDQAQIDDIINKYEDDVIEKGLRTENDSEPTPPWAEMWEYIEREEQIWR